MVAVASETPFRIAYKVWKPQPHFRKSDPPPADFLVAVASARETSLPTLSQLSALFDSVPVDEKTGGKSQFQRLKDGYRNVILAIVDSGVTSFIKFADVGFGDEPMYRWKGGRGRGGGKLGGGSGGRGRGRGSGRSGRGGGVARGVS
jgi:tRNA-splicing endonuclease subunit Sen54